MPLSATPPASATVTPTWERSGNSIFVAFLIALAAVTPWLFGAVHARVQVPSLTVLLVAAAWATATAIRDRQTLPAFGFVALIALGVLLGLSQLVPLPRALEAFLSPNGMALRDRLLPQKKLPEEMPLAIEPVDDIPLIASDVATANRNNRTLSIHPAATRRDMTLLAMALLALALGSHYFRTPAARIALFTTLAVNGAAIAVFGIVQQRTWNGRLYGVFSLERGGLPFGPYINRNNGAGYLALCAACSVGLLVWAWTQSAWLRSGEMVSSGPEESEKTSHALRRWQVLFAGVVGLVTFLIISTGVLMSLSRGGFLSLCAAGIVTCLAVSLAVRGRGRWWGLALAVVLGGSLAAWIVTSEQIAERLETLLDRDALLHDERLENWSDAWRAVPDFWKTGVGLGAYGYICPPYEQRSAYYFHQRAENQYLETLVTGGLPGLVLLLAAIAVVAVATVRLLCAENQRDALPLACVGTFALTSQLVHGWLDFGLFLPANFLVMGFVCGSIVVAASELDTVKCATKSWRWSPLSSWRLPAGNRGLVIILLSWGALLVVGGLAWCELRKIDALEPHVLPRPWADSPDAVSEVQVERSIVELGEALQTRWDDAEAHLRLADYWIRLYRLRALKTLRKEFGPAATDSQLWSLTDLGQLHARAVEWARQGNTENLASLRAEPSIAQCLKPAWNHLLHARAACAFLPEAHLRLALLSFLAGDPLHDAEHLARLRVLEPSNARYLFAAGIMHLEAGRDDEAFAVWRDCWSVDHWRRDQILKIVEPRLSLVELLENLAPASPETLERLANERYNGPDQTAERALILQRAADLRGDMRGPSR